MGGIATSPIPISQSLGALLAFMAVLFIPGFVVCLAAGLRGCAPIGAAPVVTFGLIGAISPYARATWLPWNILTFSAAVAVLVALILVLRIYLLRSRPAWSSPVTRPTLKGAYVAACVAVSSAIGAWTVWWASQRFQAFPQWWDTTFHANAIRFIADSENADPAALRIINNPSLESFYYPSAYHALCALVVRMTGIPIEAVLNMSDALSTGILALGLAVLVITMGGTELSAGSVALVSCMPASALYDIMVWGPLFPYVLGTALIPAFLVTLISCLRSTDDLLLRPAILALAGLGLVALHPGAAFAAALLALLLVVQLALTRDMNKRSWAGLAVALLVIVALGFLQLRGFLIGADGASFDWPAGTPPAEAVGQLLLQDRVRDHPQWWLLGLVLLGAAGLPRQRPMFFYLIGTLIFAGLYVGAASYEGKLVADATRPWWNDPYRLLALASQGMILLAGFGIAGAIRKVRVAATSLSNFFRAKTNSFTTRLLRSVGTLTVLFAVLALTNFLYADANVARVRQLYGSGPTVTLDKLAAYRELSRLVQPGARVMNDPQDGSPWMWAYAGVIPVFGHALMLPGDNQRIDQDQRTLLYAFNQVGRNELVDDALSRTRVRYVVLTNGFITEGMTRAPGLRDLDQSSSLRKVFENRDAVIYQIATTVQ